MAGHLARHGLCGLIEANAIERPDDCSNHIGMGHLTGLPQRIKCVKHGLCLSTVLGGSRKTGKDSHIRHHHGPAGTQPNQAPLGIIHPITQSLEHGQGCADVVRTGTRFGKIDPAIKSRRVPRHRPARRRRRDRLSGRRRDPGACGQGKTTGFSTTNHPHHGPKFCCCTCKLGHNWCLTQDHPIPIERLSIASRHKGNFSRNA